MKKQMKSNKGISLIVLAITIVVMVILAAVVYRMAVSDTGVIANASESAKKNEMATFVDKVKGSFYYDELSAGKKLHYTKTKKAIADNMKSEGVTVRGGSSFPIISDITGKYGKYVCRVQENGEVTIGEEDFSDFEIKLRIQTSQYYDYEKDDYEIYPSGIESVYFKRASAGKNGYGEILASGKAEAALVEQVNYFFSLETLARGMFGYIKNNSNIMDYINDETLISQVTGLNDIDQDIMPMVAMAVQAYAEESADMDSMWFTGNYNARSFSSEADVIDYLKGSVNGVSRFEYILRNDAFINLFVQMSEGATMNEMLDSGDEEVEMYKEIMSKFTTLSGSDSQTVGKEIVDIMADYYKGQGAEGIDEDMQEIKDSIDQIGLEAFAAYYMAQELQEMVDDPEFSYYTNQNATMIPYKDSNNEDIQLSVTEYAEEMFKKLESISTPSGKKINFNTLKSNYIDQIYLLLSAWPQSTLFSLGEIAIKADQGGVKRVEISDSNGNVWNTDDISQYSSFQDGDPSTWETNAVDMHAKISVWFSQSQYKMSDVFTVRLYDGSSNIIKEQSGTLQDFYNDYNN